MILENEAERNLHTAGVRAVREALRSAAVADVRDAVGQNRLQDAAGRTLYAAVWTLVL